MVSISMGNGVSVSIGTITVSMAETISAISISGLSGSSGLGISSGFSISGPLSKVVSMMSVSVTKTVSVSVSGLGVGHGGKGNKGKSDTLHNAANYDYVFKKRCDGADDLCRYPYPG